MTIPDTTPVKKPDSSKAWVGFASVVISTLILRRMQTDGIDFSQFGMDADTLKMMIESAVVTFFVWITPSRIVDSVTDAIKFVRDAVKQWRSAANS